MMKSIGKRVLGVILCVSLVFGTVTLPTFADDSVPIPTGQNDWREDDQPSDSDSPASSDEGTQSDPEGDLPIDTDPISDNTDTNGAGNEAPNAGDPAADDGASDGSLENDATGDGLAPEGGEANALGDPEIGIQGAGDPISELEAAKRIVLTATIHPESVRTGATTSLSFFMNHNPGLGEVQVDPSKLRATVTVPKGIGITIPDNSRFNVESNTANEAGDTVITLVFNEIPNGGDGGSFEAVILNTVTGTVADGSTYDVPVKWTYGEDALFDGDQICTITNIADQFGWSNLRGAATSSLTATGSHVPDITVQYSLNNAALSASTGLAYTKSIEISDLITVNEKIAVTSDMLDSLEWTYNNAALPGGSYEIVSYQDGSAEYIKEFRVKNTITNAALGTQTPADMNHINSAVKLIIKGVRVNTAKANTDTPKQISISPALSSGSLIASIYPCVSANSGSLNMTDDQQERYQELTATSRFSTAVSYFWTGYEPEDPTDPAQSGRIEKHVKSVTTTDGKVQTDKDRILFAEPGEKVTYMLENFGNYLEEKKLQNFVVTDEFNLDEMYPVTLSPGRYLNGSGNVKIRVYVKDGGVETEAYSKEYSTASDWSGTTLDLRTISGLDVTKISKIEFDYTAVKVDPNFRAYPDKGPAITVFVRNRYLPNPGENEDRPQATLTNTALVSYDCEGTTYNYDSLTQEQKDIEFNFKSEREITYYQTYVEETGNKSYIRIRGNNPTSTTVEAGDLLEYTLTFTNNTEKYTRNPFIDDTYGAGLEPYIEDDPAYNLTGSGYEKPFVSLVSVIDEAGRDVTAARDLVEPKVFVGEIPYDAASVASGAYVYEAVENPDFSAGQEPLIKDHMMRIRFRSNSGPGGHDPSKPVPAGYIHPGDVITVTYVMRVTDPSQVNNKFDAYGYPIHTGSPELIHMDGGENKGGPAKPNPDKPTVKLTQIVTRQSDGNQPVNTTYAVEDGELLNVALTLQNSGKKSTFPMTLYGFTSTLYTATYDVLKYVQSDTIKAKVYKTPQDPNPTELLVTMETPGTGFYSNNSYKQRTALVFRDSEGNVAPVTMNPSTLVELSFQLKAEGWGADDVSSSAQTLYTFAIFKEPSASFSGQANSGYAQGNCNNYIGSMTGTSYLRAYTTIYLAKRKVPIVQAWATSLNTGYYLPLNNLQGVTRPERTAGNSYGVQIRNVGKVDLPITKIYVKLPKNERFDSLVPYKTSTHYYAANFYKADVLGIFEDGRQVVVLTPTANDSKVLKPNYYAGRPNSTSNSLIGIQTYVENDTAAQMITDHIGQSTFLDSKIEVAIYSEGTELLSDPSSNRIIKVDDAERPLWGADASIGDLYKATTGYDGKYLAYYPVPGIQLSALRKYSDGSIKEDNVPFGPGDKAVWRVKACLENHSNNLRELQDAVAVLKLPTSMTYDGIVESEFTGVQTYTGEDGYLYVVVPLGTLKAGADRTFNVSTVLGARYGSQTAEAFLFGSDEFYNSRSGWGAIQKTSDFPDDIKAKLGMTPGVNMVKNTKLINVSGLFSFTSEKTVSVPDGTAIDRGMEAKSRKDQVLTYTLTLSNSSEASSKISYTGLTIIDRLPIKGDKFVLADESSRGSTTKVTMKTAPVVATASVDDKGNISSNWTTVDPSKYTVQYVGRDDISPSYPFTNADFRLPDEGGGSSTPAGWIDAGSWPQNKEAAAFRILMDEALPSRMAIRVTYQADAPEEDMPKQGAKAVNSFAAGFQADISGFIYKVKPEPDFAQVIFPDLKPMIIEGTLFTEEEDKVDGIYQSGVDHLFGAYQKGDIKLTLYRADDEQGTNRSAVKSIEPDPASSVYKFDELYDEGVYSVEITGIPDGFVIYEEIVANNDQGNKFDQDGLAASIPYEEGKIHRRNADILAVFKGTLTLHKALAEDHGQVGGKNQKFVFRIDYTPVGESEIAQTFYEVLSGNQSKVVVDLPRGTYVVTEVAGWATGFEQVGGTAYLSDNNTMSRQTPHLEATCTNQRKNNSFLHAIGEAINNFNEKAPTLP